MAEVEISNASIVGPATSNKRKRAPRGTPTKADLKKAAKALKEARKKAWVDRCARKRWIPDSSYSQSRGTRVMHHTAAERYFRLTRAELGTLPYIVFDNKHHPAAPAGKSYEFQRLLRLVYTKFAFLARVPTLTGGRALFDAYAAKLDANGVKYKKKERIPEIWVF